MAIGIVTGTTDTGRSYNILTDEGTSLRRNRSHLKPRCHDIPIISRTLPSRTSTSSQSEITGKPLPGTKHPPKVKYFYNNEQNISFQDQYKQHPPKAKYFPNNNVPKLVIRRVGDTTYDSYIAETLYPLKSTITENIAENIVTSQNATPSQREILSETGTGTSSSEDVTHSDGDTPEDHLHQTGSQSNNEVDCESRESATPSQSEIFSGYNNSSNNNSDSENYTSSQSEITSEYDSSSEPSSREASNPSSPESGNLSVRTVYSPTPEMAIIHRTMHDAIHAVREQQGRVVTRSLLNQQKAIAASKLQCNIQIKRTSTPEHPPTSNVPPRRARARSEKANGVTSGSSEESDSEPQTSRMARFQALKMRFETPTKSEEESQSHGTSKRQRLFRKTSSQSATDCPSKEYHTPGPSRRLNGTASEGD